MGSRLDREHDPATSGESPTLPEMRAEEMPEVTMQSMLIMYIYSMVRKTVHESAMGKDPLICLIVNNIGERFRDWFEKNSRVKIENSRILLINVLGAHADDPDAANILEKYFNEIINKICLQFNSVEGDHGIHDQAIRVAS